VKWIMELHPKILKEEAIRAYRNAHIFATVMTALAAGIILYILSLGTLYLGEAL
jgi:hypothetical protein